MSTQYKEDTVKKDIVIKITNYLKNLFLTKMDFEARTLDQILDAIHEPVYPSMFMWIKNRGLPGVKRIEATTDEKFRYSPPLSCRDTESLWALLKNYNGKRGMLVDDVLESIPGDAADAIKRIESKLIRITRMDNNKDVLFIKNEERASREFPEYYHNLWHSRDCQVTKEDIRRMLEEESEAGTNNSARSKADLEYRRPRLRAKRNKDVENEVKTKEVAEKKKFRFVKHNVHVQDQLVDYSDGGKNYGRPVRRKEQ